MKPAPITSILAALCLGSLTGTAAAAPDKLPATPETLPDNPVLKERGAPPGA